MLPVMLAQWARMVDALERGAVELYPLEEAVLHRHQLALALRGRATTAETREMLAELDDAFRAVTAPAPTCVVGEERATAEGWTPTREWYCWRQAV